MNADNPNYKPKVSIYTIVSPSMTPNINVYDVVVNVRPEHPNDIQVGDIITYKSTAATSEGMTITHRVIAKNQLPDGTYEYLTQGDNNSEPDSVYVTYNHIIGKEIITIPKVGHIQFLIANQKGWLFLLLIPIAIYLLKEVFKLVDLMGLRSKVKRIVENNEEQPKIKEINHEKQEETKNRIRENLQKNEARKDSYIRNTLEPSGFLEKYSETIIEVKKNKYKKDVKEKEEVKVEVIEEPVIIVPTKVDTEKIIPEQKKELELELPKMKTKQIMVNEEYEILDTSDLNIKIQEYDTKIEEIDDMIKDINTISPIVVDTPEEIIEVDDYLTGSKIKVIKIEETKNKRREKITTSKKKEKKISENDVTINLSGIIQEVNNRIKIERPAGEDIKKVRKDAIEKSSKSQTPKEVLKLKPDQVKKINRKPKQSSQKTDDKKLKLNPQKIKKVNRPGKKVEAKTTNKKESLIRIEKRK
jgi:signal peptidase I